MLSADLDMVPQSYNIISDEPPLAKMCIRDRGNLLACHSRYMDMPQHGKINIPVSYTHLDVYKRQVNDGLCI